METRKTTGKINKTMACFFQKANKIDKPLAPLRKKTIRNARGDITADNKYKGS